MRSVLSFPLRLLHRVFGILSAAILGCTAVAVGVVIALGVVVAIVLISLWLLLGFLLTMAGIALGQATRVVDPTYGTGKEVTEKMMNVVTHSVQDKSRRLI